MQSFLLARVYGTHCWKSSKAAVISLWAHILSLSHYPWWVGYPDVRLRCDKTWREMTICTWRFTFIRLWGIAKCAWNTAVDRRCPICNCILQSCRSEFVAKSYPRTTLEDFNCNGLKWVLKDRCSKLKIAVPISRTTASEDPPALMHNWTTLQSISSHMLTNNSTQLVRKFFITLFSFLVTNHFMTTAYHPPPHWQANRIK